MKTDYRSNNTPHVLAVAFFVVVVASSAFATPSLTATAGGAADAFYDYDSGGQTLTPGPDSLSITFGAAASAPAPSPDPQKMEAIVTATGTARYGSLAGRARAEASVKPASSFYMAGASANLDLGFYDTALVMSNTLALDTPVTLTFVTTLEATAFHFVDGPVEPGKVGAGVALEARVSDLSDISKAPVQRRIVVNSVGSNETLLMFQFDTFVGHRVDFDVHLKPGAGANVTTEFYSEGTAEVIADHTGEFFYQPSGDVTLASESGHNYAVPEPSVFGLVAIGQILLLIRRRKFQPSRR